MEIADNKKTVKQGVGKQCGLRFAVKINMLVSIILAIVAVVLVNYISSLYHVHFNISTSDYYALSEKSKSLISELPGDVQLVMFFRKSNPLFDDVKNLLREFNYEAEKQKKVRLKITFVDPERDLAEVRNLKQKYGLDQIDTILLEYNGRTKYIEASDMTLRKPELTARGPVSRIVGFRGEEMISSAIMNVVYTKRPAVYFLAGHGEHSLNDTRKQVGLSSLGYKVVHDNIEAYTLVLTKQAGVPKDCAALVIIGPTKKISPSEIDMIATYLEQGGRLLLLLDPRAESGLEPLLRTWNVKLEQNMVVGLTLTGRETLIINYGSHPITENFRNVTTMFYLPRSVEPLVTPDKADRAADRPHVTVLAAAGKESWAEVSLDQRPFKFDKDSDRKGPISVAVAVERGSVSGIDLKITPTRLVVFGDSYFISNGALANGIGGNIDIFMNSLNWLLERSSMLNIGPKVPGELRLEMSSTQLRNSYILVAIALPGIIALFGVVIVWIRRR